MKHDLWLRAAAHTGRDLSPEQLELLHRYGHWLVSEGLPAGGIGPGELFKIDSRHIGDSLLFATPFREDPPSIWDLGSGIGLPGIPLAILMPSCDFRLIDRSGRRVDLLKRAIRVLGLSNTVAEEREISDIEGSTRAIVTRATLPPEETARVARQYLEEDGIIVQGGSWTSKPTYDGWETLEIPHSVFDQSIWLLIMRHQ